MPINNTTEKRYKIDMHNNIILVTGGAGFIGSNFCRFLLEKSFKVICIDNFDTFYSEEIKWKNIEDLRNNSSFKLIKNDIRNQVVLDEIFKKYNINLVVHLAAKAGVRKSISNPNDYFDVNVNGSICLFETMKKHEVKNIVFASSSSVYGNKIGQMKESDNCDNPISPYAITKRTVELLLHSYHINSSFNVINLRLFSVYGQNQRPDLVLYKFFHRILNNQPIEIFGNPTMMRDYTFIDDVMKAFYASLKLIQSNHKTIYETVNIGNNHPTSLTCLIEEIKNVLKKDDIKIVSKDSAKGDVYSTHANIEKAKNLLNYQPSTSIKFGIRLFYEWFESATFYTSNKKTVQNNLKNYSRR